MAQRTYWKGYLKLSLVSCAVAMSPATSENRKVRFHTINRKTGNPIASRYVDAETGRIVGDDEQVKGYQRGDKDYVMLEDDELDAVALDSTHTIDIERFVPRDAVDWIWQDTPHFLTPDDEVGAEAFAVIREAMKGRNVVGLSRLVLYRRERPIMLEAREDGIVAWTLHYRDEIRGRDAYFDDIGHATPDAQALAMVAKLIDGRTGPWRKTMLRDPVQARLLDIIEAKKSRGGKKPKAAVKEAAPTPSNVINLMDALKQSLGPTKKGGGKGGH